MPSRAEISSSAATFAEWYRDVPSVNATIATTKSSVMTANAPSVRSARASDQVRGCRAANATGYLRGSQFVLMIAAACELFWIHLIHAAVAPAGLPRVTIQKLRTPV